MKETTYEPTEKLSNLTYMMLCPEGTYLANSWLGLGWAIFKHRCWHLWNDRKWKD